MNRRERLKWQLARERFQIDDPEPPALRRNARPIGEILSEVMERSPNDPTDAPEALINRWPMIAGTQIAQHTCPAFIKRGILYVYTDHPGWLTEIKRIPKAHLLKKISSVPELPAIQDLRFQMDPAIRTFRKT